MESWPPQNYEYLVQDPDDWKNRSSLQSNIFESALFQNWCIRKIRSSIGIAALSILDLYIDLYSKIRLKIDKIVKEFEFSRIDWQTKLDRWSVLRKQMHNSYGLSIQAPGLHREQLFQRSEIARQENEDAKQHHELVSCQLEDMKATLKAVTQHLNVFRILVGRWLRGSVFLMSIDNLETRHFVSTVASRRQYNLPHYPGIESIVDRLSIDLSTARPVRHVVLKLSNAFGERELLEGMDPSDEIRTIQDAATSIQKVIRGWNIRKVSSLERYREWGEFSSLGSSAACTPRSITSFIGTPDIKNI
jgi:hypothetical protein